MTDKTVVRGSGGLFYGGFGFYAVGQTTAASPPFFLSIAYPTATNAATSTVTLANGFPADALSVSRAVNPAVGAQLRNYPFPTVYQGNLSIEREIAGGFVGTISYVGNATTRVNGQIDMNAPRPGAGAVNPRRPFPTFGAINLFAGFGHSSYHSLQLKAERRFRNGFSLLSSYTWSHGLDNTQDGEDTTTPTLPQDQFNTNAEKGDSTYDLRHRSVTSVIYDLPFGRDGKWLSGSTVARAIFGGFQLGGLTVHGFPGYAVGKPIPTLPQILDGSAPANTAAVRVNMEPGTKFRYSGGGTTIAQLAIMDMEKKPYPQIARETVLSPLEMTNSTYEQPLPAKTRTKAASGHRPDGKPDRVLTITKENGKLYTKPTQTPRLELFALAEHEFTRTDANVRYAFQRSASGNVDSVRIRFDGGTTEAPRMAIDAKIPYEQIMAGKFAEAIEAYKKIKQEKPNNNAVAEGRLNNLGYSLLQQKKIAEAIAVFKANVEMYPQSFNVYDSLGEAYLENGEQVLAIAN